MTSPMGTVPIGEVIHHPNEASPKTSNQDYTHNIQAYTQISTSQQRALTGRPGRGERAAQSFWYRSLYPNGPR